MAGKTFRVPVTPPVMKVVQPKIDFESHGRDADVSCTVSGLDALVENLKQVPKVFRDAAGFEMAEIAHEIIEDAKENYVPFKTGALKDSGDADEYQAGENVNIDVMQIGMWFGAPGAVSEGIGAQQAAFARSEGLNIAHPEEYALEQHENLEYKHTPPPDMTGPKYLEKPFMAVVDTIAQRLATAAGVALGMSDVAAYKPSEALKDYVPRATYKGTFVKNYGFTGMVGNLPYRSPRF